MCGTVLLSPDMGSASGPELTYVAQSGSFLFLCLLLGSGTHCSVFNMLCPTEGSLCTSAHIF